MQRLLISRLSEGACPHVHTPKFSLYPHPALNKTVQSSAAIMQYKIRQNRAQVKHSTKKTKYNKDQTVIKKGLGVDIPNNVKRSSHLIL
jgi:hypothetical protein